MSNSNLATVKVPASTSNYTKGRNGKKITEITLHHMAGVLTAKECGNIFKKSGRGASTHYGVGKDGSIGLYVDESNTAWANSNWEANCRAVTIETSNSKTGGDWPVSDVTLNALIKLVADIAKRNNLGTLVKGKNFTWHRMYSKTTCPGNYLLNKIDYIIAEANKINNEATGTTYKAGQVVVLDKAPLYASSTTTKVSSYKTGTFYLWDSEVINNRIKITNKSSNVGKSGQVTGWIDTNVIRKRRS